MVHRPTGVSWGDPWGKPRGYPGGSPRISAGYPPGVLPEVPSGGPPWGTHGIAPVVRLVLTTHQYVWFIVFFLRIMLSDSLSLYVKTFGPVVLLFGVSWDSPGVSWRYLRRSTLGDLLCGFSWGSPQGSPWEFLLGRALGEYSRLIFLGGSFEGSPWNPLGWSIKGIPRKGWLQGRPGSRPWVRQPSYFPPCLTK